MPHLEGMYAPGNECAHLLPPAGFTLPFTPDVFRFNRTLPFYPPDPNIRPNEGDLTCPPEPSLYPKNHQSMLAAGTDTRMVSDVFRFHKVYSSSGCNPCHEVVPSSCPFKTRKSSLYKPRYPPSKPGRHFDYRYPSGPTECNYVTHKHGHVPQSCRTRYADADEVPKNFRLSNCEVCKYGECACGGQRQGELMYNAGDNILSGQDYLKPNYNLPLVMSNNTRINSASMYNNTSTTSSHFRDCNQICGNHHGDYAFNRKSSTPAVHDRFSCPECTHSYFQTNYVCRPIFDRTYLLDCPEQDGPPANTYTFL